MPDIQPRTIPGVPLQCYLKAAEPFDSGGLAAYKAALPTVTFG